MIDKIKTGSSLMRKKVLDKKIVSYVLSLGETVEKSPRFFLFLNSKNIGQEEFKTKGGVQKNNFLIKRADFFQDTVKPAVKSGLAKYTGSVFSSNVGIAERRWK